MLEKHTLVRAIYLYIFAILGLVLVIIGSVRLIDMGLKMFIFKGAEAPEQFYNRYTCQSSVPISIEKMQSPQSLEGLSADEQATLKAFLENYEKCQEEGAKIDYLSSRRQQEASSIIAMIVIGLPLYLYHWKIIKRETKRKEEEV